MKQQKESLFFQSQLFVAELCEPLTVMDYFDEDDMQSQKHSSKLEKIEISNKSDKHENSNKMNREQKKNPYGSDWANKVLEKQFGVHLAQITQRARPKWIIKKLKPVETSENKEGNSRLIEKDIKSQEKNFRQTASKSNRIRIDKIVKDYRQSFNGSGQPIPVFDANFQYKLQKYNL